MKLEIGAGAGRHPGFLTLDISDEYHPDFVADARKIPLPDGSVAYLLGLHVVEHFWWHDMDSLFAEWFRVIMLGGTIHLGTPDLDGCIKGWQDGSWRTEVGRPGYFFHTETDTDRNRWLNHKLYSTDAAGNAHHAQFNFELMTKHLKRAGFADIRRAGDDQFTLEVLATKE